MNSFLYLKKYVQSHPENRMAWYLLGKEYEAAGALGKANYCYNQAGQVYEAFESTQIPADLLLGYEERLRRKMERMQDRKKRRRFVLLLLAILALICLPSVSEQPDRTVTALPETKPAGADRPAIYIADMQRSEWTKDALYQMLLSRTPAESALLVRLNSEDGWLLWDHRPDVAASMEREEGSGAVRLQSYDPAVCLCEPAEPAAFEDMAAQWAVRQEHRLVLRSAILSFQSEHGRLPESLEELTGPYPHNRMSGITPPMHTMFASIIAEFARPGNGSSDSVPSGNAAADPQSAGTEQALLQEPLRIIVDKNNYRLAVVSGNVMLRNYPIGLGGSKTPEGSFVITEKVVNPNGSATGEFGSRGMTLSDTDYAIHGTNEPDSIGLDRSLGCVRMGREDLEELFDLVPIGTEVIIKKGVLPDQENVPKQRFRSEQQHDQTNPHKIYRWL